MELHETIILAWFCNNCIQYRVYNYQRIKDGVNLEFHLNQIEYPRNVEYESNIK